MNNHKNCINYVPTPSCLTPACGGSGGQQ